jgi:hypothetical protein
MSALPVLSIKGALEFCKILRDFCRHNFSEWVFWEPFITLFQVGKDAHLVFFFTQLSCEMSCFVENRFSTFFCGPLAT